MRYLWISKKAARKKVKMTKIKRSTEAAGIMPPCIQQTRENWMAEKGCEG